MTKPMLGFLLTLLTLAAEKDLAVLHTAQISANANNQQAAEKDKSSTADSTVNDETSAGADREELPPLKPLPAPLNKLLSSGVPLNPEQTVRLDAKNKRVLLHTQIACEDCPLEMFCCTERTKEHESILWLRSRAFVVHSALLALNAKAGEPALFTPVFTQPWGQKIHIFVNWIDKNGKLQRAPAQSWMRHSVSRYYSSPLDKSPEGVTIPHLELRYDPYNKEILWYGPMSDAQRDELLSLCKEPTYQAAIKKFHQDSKTKPMKADFVFAGSYHYVIEDTGEKVYAAEGGYLICVANFAGSLIDITEISSASDGGQSYEAWPEKVPPRDTPVVVELIPSSQMFEKPPLPKQPERPESQPEPQSPSPAGSTSGSENGKAAELNP